MGNDVSTVGEGMGMCVGFSGVGMVACFLLLRWELDGNLNGITSIRNGNGNGYRRRDDGKWEMGVKNLVARDGKSSVGTDFTTESIPIPVFSRSREFPSQSYPC